MFKGWSIIKFAHLVYVNQATNTSKYYKIYLAEGPSRAFLVGVNYGKMGCDGQVRNYTPTSSHAARFNERYSLKKKEKYIDATPQDPICRFMMPDGTIVIMQTPTLDVTSDDLAEGYKVTVKAIATSGDNFDTKFWLIQGDGWYIPHTKIYIGSLHTKIFQLIGNEMAYVELMCVAKKVDGKLKFKPLEVMNFLPKETNCF